MTSAQRRGLPPRARLLLPLALVLGVALAVHRLTRPAPAPKPPQSPATEGSQVLGMPIGPSELHELTGTAFGVGYRVQLVEQRAFDANEKARVEQTIQETWNRVDMATSTYRPDSEISQLNAHRSASVFRMSTELAPLMRAAHEVSKESGGAFDVTLRPLIEAWGFGATGPRRDPPSERLLTELMGKVGYTKLHVGDHVVTKRHMDLAVDLSGIALGYAVDKLSEALLQIGHDNHFIELGGQHRAAGFREATTQWEMPIVAAGGEGPGRGARVLRLNNLSFSMSTGSLEPTGPAIRPFGHLIDPRTGRPVENALALVGVAHPRAMVADAWATALAVLGDFEGPKLARELDLAAFFRVRDGQGGLRSVATTAFEEVERGQLQLPAAVDDKTLEETLKESASPSPDGGAAPVPLAPP